MHLAAALDKPTIGIFLSSNYRVYGPRGDHSRVVIGEKRSVTCDDIILAIADILGAYDS